MAGPDALARRGRRPRRGAPGGAGTRALPRLRYARTVAAPPSAYCPALASQNSGLVPNRTPVLSFSARESFRFRQQNAAVLQSGRGGGKFLTTSDVFVREMVLKNPQQFRVIAPRHTLDCVPPERWS